jgi:hypothetical protein
MKLKLQEKYKMQDYKLVLRSITSGATKLNADGSVEIQNAGEFISYLNTQYLSQGYKIVNVETTRTIPATDTTSVIYERAYDLVKEVVAKEK